jgi:hypothetical protein
LPWMAQGTDAQQDATYSLYQSLAISQFWNSAKLKEMLQWKCYSVIILVHLPYSNLPEAVF